ncbi:hypothetical protein K1719_003339 [Acacia pycnantha]|nr:hypothetical protein K1719_003339 [Acacia pycnantha]
MGGKLIFQKRNETEEERRILKDSEGEEVYENIDPDKPLVLKAEEILEYKEDKGSRKLRSKIKLRFYKTLGGSSRVVPGDQSCSKWNKLLFGHTKARKKQLLRRLDGINNAIARNRGSAYLDDLQFCLWKDLEDVLHQEALLWAQKARMEWLAL